MGHIHSNSKSGENLKIAFFLNLAFTILELFGGYYVNSVAIISDAVHDLGDSLALGTAWYLDKKSKQKSNSNFSFGYARFSLLGALINSLVLIAGSIFVIYEAVGRILEPQHSDANGMIVFAIFGILVNGFAAWKISKGKSLNEKVVSWHLLEDLLGWMAVLIVAIILKFNDIHYLDPALSLLITAYILWGVISRLKETLFIFLQGVPKEIDLKKIEQEILAIDSIQSLHHTHIWSLEGEQHVFSSHLVLKNIESFNELEACKAAVQKTLKKYNFQHYTLQTELDGKSCELATHNDKK